MRPHAEKVIGGVAGKGLVRRWIRRRRSLKNRSAPSDDHFVEANKKVQATVPSGDTPSGAQGADLRRHVDRRLGETVNHLANTNNSEAQDARLNGRYEALREIQKLLCQPPATPVGGAVDEVGYTEYNKLYLEAQKLSDQSFSERATRDIVTTLMVKFYQEKQFTDLLRQPPPTGPTGAVDDRGRALLRTARDLLIRVAEGYADPPGALDLSRDIQAYFNYHPPSPAQSNIPDGQQEEVIAEMLDDHDRFEVDLFSLRSAADHIERHFPGVAQVLRGWASRLDPPKTPTTPTANTSQSEGGDDE
jgi:hypothetical protein